MKKNLSLLMVATLSLLILTHDLHAFKGQTHRNITKQAIKYLIDKGVLRPSCSTAYDRISDGSVEEDLPAPPPVTSETLRNWFHFSPPLNSWYASATCDAIMWAFVSGSYTATAGVISGTYVNDFNWRYAINKAGTHDGWTTLGHIIHLLEDMAVPAHTRNDPHPFDEPLEEIAKDLVPPLPLDQSPKSVSNPPNLFEELRNHIQRNYFSDDSCFDPSFSGPVVDEDHEDNNYFYDGNGRKIAHKSQSYRIYKRMLGTEDRTLCSINRIIAKEQYEELGPIVVLYTASLIKYHLDHTNTDPCGEPESK